MELKVWVFGSVIRLPGWFYYLQSGRCQSESPQFFRALDNYGYRSRRVQSAAKSEKPDPSSVEWLAETSFVAWTWSATWRSLATVATTGLMSHVNIRLATLNFLW